MFTEVNAEVISICLDNGYRHTKVIGSQGVCVIASFIYTNAIIVNLNKNGYNRRYCYSNELANEALVAFALWDGVDHPKGRWIKCKGSIEMSNPDYPNNESHPNWIDTKSEESVLSLLQYIRSEVPEMNKSILDDKA